MLKQFFEGKKTFTGLLIIAAPTLLGFIGFNVNPAEAIQLGEYVTIAAESVDELIELFGVAVAWYGRVKAKS